MRLYLILSALFVAGFISNRDEVTGVESNDPRKSGNAVFCSPSFVPAKLDAGNFVGEKLKS